MSDRPPDEIRIPEAGGRDRSEKDLEPGRRPLAAPAPPAISIPEAEAPARPSTQSPEAAPLAGLKPTMVGLTEEQRAILRRRPARAHVAISLSPRELTVTPGQEVSCEVRVRNLGTIVDRVAVTVEGGAAGWAVVEPPLVNLYPESDAVVVRIRFRPPRQHQVLPQAIPFTVLAVSREAPDETDSDAGRLTVEPFRDLSITALRPRTSEHNLKGPHRFGLRNSGNVPTTLAVAAQNPDNLLTFAVTPAAVALAPGGAEWVEVVVRPRQWQWVGSPRTHPFRVTATPDDGETLAVDGQMVVRPIIHRLVVLGLAVILPLFVGWLVYEHLFRPVPHVERILLDLAVNALDEDFSVPDSHIEEVFDDRIRAGLVKDVDPEPGTRLRRGASVRVLLSKGPPIPDVYGSPWKAAEELLVAKGFEAIRDEEESGTVPAGFVIRTLPARNEAAEDGLVTVYVSTGQPAVPAAPEQPPPAEPPAPAPAEVTGLAISASPTSYYGACPVTVRLSSSISVRRGGKVSWSFVRSDGSASTAKPLSIRSRRTVPLADAWTLGGPGQRRFSGWQALKVLEPQELLSPPAEFRVRCRYLPFLDYDGDGKTDFAVWRASASAWSILRSSDGTEWAAAWGPGDIPVPGDYDGDGRTDLAVWRRADGVWSVTGSVTGEVTEGAWGLAGEVPVPGDYDGDGRTDLAVWRPADGTWSALGSSDGQPRIRMLGRNGDIPVPGDYDGDGIADLAVWRPANGTWFIVDTSNGMQRFKEHGRAGDVPAAADLDGDGKADLAVWRAAERKWLLVNLATGEQKAVELGAQADMPNPGDYDGDGKADLAVWRPSEGTWYYIRSSDGVAAFQVWGQDGDVPLHP